MDKTKFRERRIRPDHDPVNGEYSVQERPFSRHWTPENGQDSRDMDLYGVVMRMFRQPAGCGIGPEHQRPFLSFNDRRKAAVPGLGVIQRGLDDAVLDPSL